MTSREQDGWPAGMDAAAAALHCRAEQLAIVTRGIVKRESVYQRESPADARGVLKVYAPGPFKPLWDAAADAIKSADAIVILGYRAPPSDAYARSWLIEQLQSNGRVLSAPRLKASYRAMLGRAGGAANPVQEPLCVHAVLGDDVEHKDSRRLKGLIGALDTRIEVVPWPMFAEDFLAVVDRDRLV